MKEENNRKYKKLLAIISVITVMLSIACITVNAYSDYYSWDFRPRVTLYANNTTVESHLSNNRPTYGLSYSQVEITSLYTTTIPANSGSGHFVTHYNMHHGSNNHYSKDVQLNFSNYTTNKFVYKYGPTVNKTSIASNVQTYAAFRTTSTVYSLEQLNINAKITNTYHD